jgi:hypothetical protein
MTAIARERYGPPGQEIARHLATAAALGLLFAWFGPFGSNPALEPPVRLAFWLILIPLGYGLALAAERLIPARLPAWARLALMALASGLPNTLATALAMKLAQPERAFEPAGLAFLLLAVAGVQLVLSAIMLAWPRREVARPAPAAQPDFLRRLPPRLGRDLVAVSSEDHYVRVHTLLGSHLLLMTFSEALRQLGGCDGLRVHRCWWVARGRIEAVSRREARTVLSLPGGLQAPVSRAYRAAVRAIGA